MALLLSTPLAFTAPDYVLQELMDFSAYITSPACGTSLQGCGRTAAVYPTRPHTTRSFRVHRQPSLSPPLEPEVHITRTQEGVLARCPLGLSFSGSDVRLRLDSSGKAFTITAFHPGTETFWPERPVAFRRTLELAAHIDAARIRARLEGGVLSIFFPYLRRPQPRPSYSWIVVERPTAPAPCQQAPAPAHTVRSVPKLSSARVPVVHAQRGPAARQQAAPQAADSPAAASLVRQQPPAQQRHQGLESSTQQPRFVIAQGRRQQPPTSHAAHRPVQPEEQQSQSRLRVIPVEGPEHERCQLPHHAQAGGPAEAAAIKQTASLPATTHEHGGAQADCAAAPQPAAADSQAFAAAAEAAAGEAAADAEPAAAEVAPAPVSSASKGKAPASRKQQAAWERREAARRAAERIAAGSASNSDWEDADGSVTDCSLDD